MQKQGSEAPCGIPTDDEADLRWELRGRAHAVLAELEGTPSDWDAIETILRGAVEEIEAAT